MSTFKKKTIRDIDLHDKTVILRPEYNVPVKDGKVKDDYRITSSMPTLNYLLERNCKVVIVCNLGRPKGQVVPELSLAPVAEHLKTLTDASVDFVDTYAGDRVKQAVKVMKPGSILMLENLRFYPGEKENSMEFAKEIADSIGADYMVQNAFGNSHRAHASMEALASLVPAVAGLLVESEVKQIKAAIDNPTKPLVAVVGGVKIETKLDLLQNFLTLADRIIIGGAMANTFLVAKGYEVGDSLFEEGEVGAAKSIISAAEAAEVELFLPEQDVAVAYSVDDDAKRRDVATGEVGPEDIILDFGKKSIEKMLLFLDGASTILWNGPLGVTEINGFADGSEALAKFIAANDVYSVAGGGETAAYVNKAGFSSDFTHVSTGGGASLKLMAGKKLPAVEVLLDS